MPATSRANVHTITTTGVLTLDELTDWLSEALRAGIPGEQAITVWFDCSGLQLQVEKRFDYLPRTPQPVDDTAWLPALDGPATAEIPRVPAIGDER